MSTEAAVFYLLAPSRGKDAARVLLDGYTGVVVADAHGAYKSERVRRAMVATQPDLLDAADIAAESGERAVAEEVDVAGAGVEPLPLHDVDIGKQSRLAEALDAVPGVFQLAGCWMHARRPFFHAEQNFPEAGVVLDLIARLYGIEDAAEADAQADVKAGADPKQALHVRRKERRANESAAVIGQIRVWRMKQAPLPSSKFAAGVSYLRQNWHALTLFLTNPAIPLDNGTAERAQRPTVMGRKIHLGSRSALGTQVAAGMYSLVQSARRVGVDPADYILTVVRVTLGDPKRQAVLLPHDFAEQRRSAALEA